MSEEESEKEENENEENEDNENEENEDNENEENENEENEDEEKSEEEKNKKKDKNKKEDNSKFEEQKLIPSNEIKIDLSNVQNDNNNKNILNNNFNFEIKKNIFQILNEINFDMENLSKEINSTLKFVDTKKNSFSIKNEEEDLQTLLKKANDLCKEIDLNHKKTENKAIQSDDEFDFKNKFNNNNNENFNNNYSNLKDFPYDPNKNRDYYNSLNESMQNYQQQQQNFYNNNYNNFPNNNNNNNNFYSLPQPNFNNNFPLNSNNFNNNNFNNNFMTNNNNNFLNRFNNIGSSRVKKIDDLYRNQFNSNRQPSIYTQPETNKLNPVLLNKQNPPNDFNNINSMPNRPFERNKPGSIAQAMDILLDKQ